MSIHYLWHLDYCFFRLYINMQNLSKGFLNTERTVLIPSKAMRRKKLVFELFLCFGIPLYMIFIHHSWASGQKYRFLRSNIHSPTSLHNTLPLHPQSHLEKKKAIGIMTQAQTNPSPLKSSECHGQSTAGLGNCLADTLSTWRYNGWNKLLQDRWNMKKAEGNQ